MPSAPTLASLSKDLICPTFLGLDGDAERVLSLLDPLAWVSNEDQPGLVVSLCIRGLFGRQPPPLVYLLSEALRAIMTKLTGCHTGHKPTEQKIFTLGPFGGKSLQAML